MLDRKLAMHSRGRRGFTFIEILFAVMLLGIGFILIAAMLPVAAVQTKETVDQSVAANVAKGAGEVLESIATLESMPFTRNSADYMQYLLGTPTTAPFLALNDPSSFFKTPSVMKGLWSKVRGRQISSADPRYGWTVIYSRDYRGTQVPVAPYAQVYVIVTRCQLRDRYTMVDVEGAFPNLSPRLVMVTLKEGTVDGVPGPDIIEFNPKLAGHPRYPDAGPWAGVATENAVAEGTFVIIADDQQKDTKFRWTKTYTPQEDTVGMANGRVYRVGRQRPDLGPNKWELAPGWDMPSGRACGSPGPNLIMYDEPGQEDNNQNIPILPESISRGRSSVRPARAYIVGRSVVNPPAPDAASVQFDGPAQDIGVFTTYIPLVK